MSVFSANRFALLSNTSSAKQPQPKALKSKTNVQEMKKVAATLENNTKQNQDQKKRGGDKPGANNRGRGNNRGGRGGLKRTDNRNPEDKPKREGGAPRRGRKFDRHSGTGRNPNETKKGNHGKGNWGSHQDTVTAEKETLNAHAEPVVGEPEPNVQVQEEEEVDNTLSLAEVEKQREENRAKFDLPPARVVEEDDDLKQKFAKLDKKAPEAAPKTAKKKQENKPAKKQQNSAPVQIELKLKEEARSSRGGRGRGGNTGNRGRGKQGKASAYTVNQDEFPALS